MTNLEVAKYFVSNAMAYGKMNDMKTVMNNLYFIKRLLEKPEDTNRKWDWEDFK